MNGNPRKSSDFTGVLRIDELPKGKAVRNTWHPLTLLPIGRAAFNGRSWCASFSSTPRLSNRRNRKQEHEGRSLTVGVIVLTKLGGKVPGNTVERWGRETNWAGERPQLHGQNHRVPDQERRCSSVCLSMPVRIGSEAALLLFTWRCIASKGTHLLCFIWTPK